MPARAMCTCRHGTHGEGTGHAPLCPACPGLHSRSTFSLIDYADPDNVAFVARKRSQFSQWLARKDLASAIATIPHFRSEGDFRILELVSSGKKDRFGQELIDRVILRDAKGAQVKSWNPQKR